jgi:glycosyltransferase involved in cell wall biosynthesis
MQEKPIITIITPTFNQGKYIDRTIQSVIKQDYPHVQYIIVDGGSTDNTSEILNKYKDKIDKIICEPDEGQADALNKGLRYAKGEIIGWINSDDYYEKNIFEYVVNRFIINDYKWIIGNIKYHYQDTNKIIECRSPKITYNDLIKNPDIVKQQGAFFKRETLNEVGGWNKDLYMAMDYDLWLKLAKISEPLMVQKSLAYYTIHKEQKSNIKNNIKQLKNIILVLRKNKINIFSIHWILKKKYIYLIKGYIKYILIYIGIIDIKYKQRSYLR